MHWANSEQQAHMRSLAALPRVRLSWCGWNLKGECARDHGGRCADPNLSNADKCLPCTGYGRRWRLIEGDREWAECPDCQGTGKCVGGSSTP